MRTRLRVLIVAGLVGCVALLASCGSSDTKPAVGISINPASSTISVHQTATFTATVTGTTNQGVTWSATGGTVADGVFTPPMQVGSYIVTATSLADNTKFAGARVTVTAPDPVFSSTPPDYASEGVLYTYTVEAADELESEITYSLVGPEGAEIEGNTITWTPSAEQARLEQTFTVTAETPAGTSADQTWTITPNGIIRGSYIDKYWQADGTSIDVPQDMTDWQIVAFVVPPPPSATPTATPTATPSATPPLIPYVGTGNADGTFEIPDVPAGKYWLLLSPEMATGAVQGFEVYLTSSSTFDFGSDYIGRPLAATPPENTTVQYSLFGMNPWSGYDCGSFSEDPCNLSVVTPNAGASFESGYYLEEDQTDFYRTEGSTRDLATIDPEQGDITYVLQRDRVDRSSQMALRAQVIAATSALASDKIATNPGEDFITPIEGQMGGTPKAFDFNVKGSEWSSLLLTSGPEVQELGPFNAQLSTMPFVTDKFAFWQPQIYGGESTPTPDMEGEYRGDIGVPLAQMNATLTSMDMDMGAFRYVNPFPADWKTTLAAQQLALVPVYVPDYESNVNFEAGASFVTDSLPSGPIAPLMSNVKNPTIQGKDFFTSQDIEVPEGESLTLAWEAPTGLAPMGYEVSMYYAGGEDEYDYQWIGSVYTADTSIVIPPIFPPYDLVFTIRAMADGRANVQTQPWRLGLPMADAVVVSGAVTFEGEKESALMSALKKLASKASENAAKNPAAAARKAAMKEHLKARRARSLRPAQKNAPAVQQ